MNGAQVVDRAALGQGTTHIASPQLKAGRQNIGHEKLHTTSTPPKSARHRTTAARHHMTKGKQ